MYDSAQLAKSAATDFVSNHVKLVLRARPGPTGVRTPHTAAVLLQQRAIMSAVTYMTLVLATLRALSLRIVAQTLCVLLISAVSQAPVSKSRITRTASGDGVVKAPWPLLSGVLAGHGPKVGGRGFDHVAGTTFSRVVGEIIGSFLCQRLVIEGLPQARHEQSSKMTRSSTGRTLKSLSWSFCI